MLYVVGSLLFFFLSRLSCGSTFRRELLIQAKNSHQHSNNVIFGIPHGGGFFGGWGGKDNNDKATGKDKEKGKKETEHDDTKKNEKDEKEEKMKGKKMYPAMTNEEIQEWLEHIPVFALTNLKGTGVVTFLEDVEEETSLDDNNNNNNDETSTTTKREKKNVSYFFMDPKEANNALQQIKTNGKDMNGDKDNIMVSVISLGKIWFQLFGSTIDDDDGGGDGNQQYKSSHFGGSSTKVQLFNSKTKEKVKCEYRLRPGIRDRISAQMLLTMSEEDQKTFNKEHMNPESAKRIIEKAIANAPQFNSTYNDIPLFTINELRMREGGSNGGENIDEYDDGNNEPPMMFLPMHFSIQSLFKTWVQFVNNAPEEMKKKINQQPTVHLISLHKLIQMMKKESINDWRSTVLVPSSSAAHVGNNADFGKSVDDTNEQTEYITMTRMMNGNDGSTLDDL